MDILIVLWLSTATALSAFGAGCMFHFCYSSKDDTPERGRRIRFMTIIVVLLWIVLGLNMMARMMVHGVLS